ncbi:BRD4-interacting chromatin-remodeling complex-associated protein isoform X2 [Dunckerocampus dactyliophorus]|uniref:BRD4-interacting chromatin-remodeling complex-associated protein isoform X2 n=1 Tax=Dunckerocampus dactyliophorus TaxID=161453 RepID=UPI002405B8E5|nr:BRD4-interacting chromatin-remodeling complex-associated protein isoform X2 [Dunckerocampus dactyliophorus]
MDMEDEDGTCLLDVLCDPQALNDFLHGTTELQTEDLLISASSGEPSLFTDAPSPVSLLGDGGDSPGTPPPGCVDLSFLEEALLSSPEGRDDGRHQVDRQTGSPMGPGCESKEGEAEGEEAAAGEEEAEVACCDILQQSLQEADITEQTVALEGGQTQDSVSLFSPATILSPPTAPFVAKTTSVAPTLPKDTQAAVEPPQPSLLAVGPGCPSLKPSAPPQLMGLLPGNVFPAPSPETTFSLSPVQGSSMIIHKAMTSVMGRPLLAPTLRAAAAHGIILQRAPLPIQPKLPISIQPKLVQISPKPSGQKPATGLTLVPGTVSPNILLSQPTGQTPAAPPPAAAKPVSLQLVNQGGSFVLQPQGLFQGQNQFLLPGQSQVTISQPGARPLLTAGPQGRGGTPVSGHLVDGSQILTVPQRQLNFSPVFTTTGQLALSQATVLSGPLQLQSAPSAVFQMPAQLAGNYTTGGQRATLVHGPTLGNHITLINSAGMLPSDLASISIVNTPSVVQGLPFTAQAALTDPPLGLQPASVVLLPERGMPEERNTSEESFLQLPQHFGQVIQHPVSMQPATPPSPSVVTVIESQTEPALAPAVEMPSADLVQVVEEVAQSLSQNQDFMQQLQQQALSSPITSDILVGAVPVVPVGSLTPSVDNEQDSHQATVMLDPCVDSSPLPSEDTSLLGAFQSAAMFPNQDPLLGPESSPPQYQDAPEFQGSQSLFVTSKRTLAAAQALASHPGSDFSLPQSSEPPFTPRGASPLHVSIPVPQQQPDPSAASLCGGGNDTPVQQHTLNSEFVFQTQNSEFVCKLKVCGMSAPTAALAIESELMSLYVHPSSPDSQEEHLPAPREGGPFTNNQQLAGVELQREEPVTPAMRQHRFQQLLCTDHMAVQHPCTSTAFPTLRDAAQRLLPYHVCAGLLPTQDDFTLVDQEFDTVSRFLLRRTKDMVNKYRQLLVRETQESPSAEMVMLERLFLQAERFSLGEDRRRARRDPEYFRMSLAASASSSGASSSPPAWTRLSDRPPGLKTYRSSSRGALRLTIKQEVVHSSLKRDHKGQLTNGGGGGAATLHPPQATNGSSHHPELDENGAEGASQAHLSRMKDPLPVPQAVGFEPPPRDTPKVKCLRLDVPPHAPLQEDNVLSEHLQSAINSILELQRLQGPSGGPLTRAPVGSVLDQPVTSVLGGHL